MNTRVRCQECGREERANFGVCLTHGWPHCHNRQMQLVEVEEGAIDVDMGKVLAPIAEMIQRVARSEETDSARRQQ